jgi:protein gp37
MAMGKDSKIEWTDHTFNAWWGCEKIAPECAFCYAATFDTRIGGAHWGADAPRRFFGDAHWREPLKWNEEAKTAGQRRRVFCSSMSDVGEIHADEAVNEKMNEARARLRELIKATPWLDWLLLTKRPENLILLFGIEFFLKQRNVWVGTTAGTQATAEKNIPPLLNVPAAIHFLSMEPLLEAVDLSADWNCLDKRLASRIDWVIVGGESGPNARPMHPDWARSLRDQCEAKAAWRSSSSNGGNGHRLRITRLAASIIQHCPRIKATRTKRSR